MRPFWFKFLAVVRIIQRFEIGQNRFSNSHTLANLHVNLMQKRGAGSYDFKKPFSALYRRKFLTTEEHFYNLPTHSVIPLSQ